MRKPRLPRRRLSLVQGEFEQSFLRSNYGAPFVIGGGLGLCDLCQNLPAGSEAYALERAFFFDVLLVSIRFVRFHPRPFPLSVTPDVTPSHKKRDRQLGLLGEHAEAFTASSRLAKVVFSRSRSIALCAEVNTFSRVSRMQCPTGHSVLGFREGLLNVSVNSTALYTSAKLMRPGDRFNREPEPAPLQVSTSFARCKASRSRRTITGFVLTLLASMADVTRSPSL